MDSGAMGREKIMAAIPIFFIGSAGLVSQTVVAIDSIACNTDSDIAVYILDCGIAADDVRALREVCAVHGNIKSLDFLPVDTDRFEGLNEWRGYADAWSRFLFPQLAPNIDKALYLDSDIVAMGDVKKLYDIDLEGRPIAAAVEIFHESEKCKPWREKWKRLGLPPDHKYFGSGILVFDCKKWREENLADRIYEIGSRYGSRLIAADQDALNILFGNNDYKAIGNDIVATSLDVLYFERERPAEYRKMQKNIVIRHLNGWKPFARAAVPYGGRLFPVPHAENWWRYAGRTPYASYFLHRRGEDRKRVYVRLFGLIPLLKIANAGGRDDKLSIKLFGIIPLFTIKN
jgi:lipopolysaccharide biosynthesis glycosyltransferase